MQEIDLVQNLRESNSQPLFVKAPKHEQEFGDFILNCLASIGVEYIFGVPGGAIEPLYNAMARSERLGGIKAVVACHETAAAFMADGYARESGGLGVCCATTGPGTTNLITGVASAYADNIPLLVITPQTSITSFGSYGLQESSCTGIDTVSMLKFCTHYNTLVSHPNQLARKLQTAINYAFGPVPGPVHLSIPVDILRSTCTIYDDYKYTLPNLYRNQAPSAEVMEELVGLIGHGEPITLVIGEGCEGAMAQILRVAQMRCWSVVSTPMAKGLIDSNHPCYCGVFGMAGYEYAQRVLSPDYCQTVIFVGGNLDEIATGGWNKEGLYSERLIHIDDNPKHLAQSAIAQLQVYGSPGVTFQELYDRLSNSTTASRYVSPMLDVDTELPIYMTQEEREKCSGSGPIDDLMPIKPQYLVRQLSLRCPDNTRVAADSGCSYLWTIHYWEFSPQEEDGRNLFRAGMGYSSMGWAIGASIGLAKASPSNPVVCITGDGSVLMSGQDITTASIEKTNILFVILNDSSYGMVKHGQRLAGAEPIGYNLKTVNFAEVAQAMGIEAYHLKTKSEFDAIDLERLLSRPGPCLLDIVIDGEEVPPMGQRMKVLGTIKD